jgi:hypothetical protein
MARVDRETRTLTIGLPISISPFQTEPCHPGKEGLLPLAENILSVKIFDTASTEPPLVDIRPNLL